MSLSMHIDDEMIYGIRHGHAATIANARDSDSGWAITIGEVSYCGYSTREEARDHLRWLKEEAKSDRGYLPKCHGAGAPGPFG